MHKRLESESTKCSVSLRAYFWVREHLRARAAQGTTEYAILVGVLVVIAMVAIALFKPKIQELWTAIADGINAL